METSDATWRRRGEYAAEIHKGIKPDAAIK